MTRKFIGLILTCAALFGCKDEEAEQRRRAKEKAAVMKMQETITVPANFQLWFPPCKGAWVIPIQAISDNANAEGFELRLPVAVCRERLQ